MASPRASREETSRPPLPAGPAVFLPLSEKEASESAGRKLPTLNYRPRALETWYLVSMMGLFLVFFGGLVALMVIGHRQPHWLHFGSTRSYNLWFYTPGLAGFVTTVLWRSTMQWYNRIIPYARMASLDLRREPGRDWSHYHLHSAGLNGTPGASVNLGMLLFLWRCGDYLSFVVNFSQFFIFILTPLKSTLFRLVEDDHGWTIHVSRLVCIGGAFIFAWLFVVTLCVLVFFRNHRTGLRWSPTTLATQISLLQGSNVFSQVSGVDTTRFDSLPYAVRDWYNLGWVLRLGYWREQRTDLVTYGVRFMSTDPEMPLPDNDTRRAHPGSHRDHGTAVYFSGDPGDTDGHELETLSLRDSRDRNATETFGPSQARSIRVKRPRSPHDNVPMWSSVEYGNEEADRQDFLSDKLMRNDITRIFNFFQMDPYILLVTFIGVGSLVAATFFWVRGDLAKSFQLQMLKDKSPEGNEQSSFNMSLRAERWLLLYMPLVLMFGSFHVNFVSADIYHRTMAPISKMAGRLADEDRARIKPFDLAHSVNGASARESVLLDYLAPDPVSCVAKAVMEGEYRIAVGVVLASVSNTLYLLLAQLFHFDDKAGQGYSVRFNLNVFYALYAILVIYCVSIWVLRPRGPIRTCRLLHTLMDTAILVHQSPMLLCPEFFCEPPLALEEAQFQAQILLADRVHSYGVYTGMDGETYVGATVDCIPEAWHLYMASHPEASDNLSRLRIATELQRRVIQYGVYDDIVSCADDVSRHAGEATYVQALLRRNKYVSWRAWAKSL